MNRKKILGKVGRGLAGLVLAGGLASGLPSLEGCSGLKQGQYERTKGEFRWCSGEAGKIEQEVYNNELFFERKRRLLEHPNVQEAYFDILEKRPVEGENTWGLCGYQYRGQSEKMFEMLGKKLPKLVKSIKENNSYGTKVREIYENGTLVSVDFIFKEGIEKFTPRYKTHSSKKEEKLFDPLPGIGRALGDLVP